MTPQHPWDPSGEGYPPPAAEPYPPAGQPYPPAGQSYPPAGQSYPTAPLMTDDKAVWALVTAVGGYFLCPIILHVVAWVLANQSLSTIRSSGGTIGGEGVASVARVLAIVGLVLYGVAILLVVLLLVVGVVVASNADSASVATGAVTA